MAGCASPGGHVALLRVRILPRLSGRWNEARAFFGCSKVAETSTVNRAGDSPTFRGLRCFLNCQAHKDLRPRVVSPFPPFLSLSSHPNPAPDFGPCGFLQIVGSRRPPRLVNATAQGNNGCYAICRPPTCSALRPRHGRWPARRRRGGAAGRFPGSDQLPWRPPTTVDVRNCA